MEGGFAVRQPLICYGLFGFLAGLGSALGFLCRDGRATGIA